MVFKRLNERIGSGDGLDNLQMTRKLVLYILGENTEIGYDYDIPEEFEKYWNGDEEIFTYFRGKTFSNLDLSNINFSKVDFTGCKFRSINFDGSNLDDSLFMGVKAVNCSFDNIFSRYILIEDSVFNNCTFNGSKLPEEFKNNTN